MQFRRPSLVACLAAAALVVGAAGCSGDKPDTPVGAARADSADSAKRVEVPSTTKPRGGNLRVGVTGLSSLDPALANEASPSQSLVIDLLFDGLTRHDPLAGDVRSAVAASWSTTADGLTWVFTIDPAARFSNGASVSSLDAKRSIERVAARGSASLSGALLAPIKGYADFAAKKASGIAGLKADDPTKLTVTLDRPFSPLAELLASPVFGIVPGDFDTTVGGLPATSGRLAVRDRAAGRFHLEPAPGATMRLDSLDVFNYPDTATALAAFSSRTVDLVALPSDKAASLPGDATVIANPSGNSYFYGINVAASGLDNVGVRSAITKAVDRAAVRDKFFAGSADVMTGLIPAGVQGRRENACGQQCTFDQAAAKDQLAKALAGKTLPVLHVDYFDEPSGREVGVAKQLADSLNAIGLKVEPRGHTFDEFQTFVASGRAEIFRFGWVGTYASPDDYLASLFASAGSDNIFGFKDKEVDAALSGAQSAVDANERVTRYLAAEDRVLALVPLIPLVQYRTSYGIAASVHGVESGPLGFLDLTNTWVG